MRIIDIISEARKNPKLNPKTSINQHIIDAYEKADTLPNSTIKNAFASFTHIDKLGINPGSTFNTPLGIYAYPLGYIIETANDTYDMSILPYAGDAPYATIFSAKGNIIDLNTISQSEVEKYTSAIRDIILDMTKQRGKRILDEFEFIVHGADQKAFFSHVQGGILWYITYKTAHLISTYTRSKPLVVWNSLFRKIGIDGCVDVGTGIIHSNEPTQAVFFSTKSFTNISRVFNKYSPEAQENAISHGLKNKQKKEDIKKMTYQELAHAISTRPSTIQYVNSPDEKLQLIAVHRTIYALKHIKSPTPKVQVTAVNNAHSAFELQFITSVLKSPAEEALIAMVTRFPTTLKYMVSSGVKPPEKVQLLAIKEDPTLYKLITNPSPAVTELYKRLTNANN